MNDLGLLILRLTLGTLIAGHGSQKMFGWFGGPGLKGTHGFMESLGMKPGKVWGTMAAASELGGGILTALGFLNPLGPISIIGTMAVAMRRAHWGKPIWNSQGGIEFPLTNMAAATCLALTGPGRFSVDRMFGIRMPRWMTTLCVLGGAGFTYLALQRPEVAQQIVEKATTIVPVAVRPSDNPDVEVETRPAAQDEAASQSTQTVDV